MADFEDDPHDDDIYATTARAYQFVQFDTAGGVAAHHPEPAAGQRAVDRADGGPELASSSRSSTSAT